jgi:hypothetical protein
MNSFIANITNKTKNIHITPKNLNVRLNPAFSKEPYFFCKMDATIRKDKTQRKATKIT